MRRLILASVAAVLVLAGLLLTPAATPPAQAGTVTCGTTTTADTYVKQSPGASSNFGTATVGEVQGGTTAQRKTYLKFDCPSLPGGETITAASLRLVFSKVQAQAVEIRTVTDVAGAEHPNSWTETGLTWNNSVVSWPANALLDSHTVAVGAQTFNVTSLVTAGSATYSFVVQAPASSSNYQFRTKEYGTAGDRPTLTLTTAPPPTTTAAPTTTTAPPVEADWLADSQLKTSEFAAWSKDAAEITSGVDAKVEEAGITTIKISAHDCFAADGSNAAQTCGRDSHTGTLTRADFRAKVAKADAISTVQHLTLKFAPMSKDLMGSPTAIDGDLFCPTWTGSLGTPWMDMHKAQIDEIATAGWTGDLVLTFSEPEFACVAFWQSVAGGSASIGGAGSIGVSDKIGDMYAEAMPTLEAYAEAKAVFDDVYTIGYIGVPGGPGWGSNPAAGCPADGTKTYGFACTFNDRWIEEFLDSLDANAVAYPNEVTTHIYVHGPDNDCSPTISTACPSGSYDGYDFNTNIALSYYDLWAEQVQAALTAHGHSEVRYGIGEWQAGVSRTSDAWCGWAATCTVDTNGETPAEFDTNWLNMLDAEGFHTANVFLIAGNSDSGVGGKYNWVTQAGGEGPGYTSIKNFTP